MTRHLTALLFVFTATAGCQQDPTACPAAPERLTYQQITAPTYAENADGSTVIIRPDVLVYDLDRDGIPERLVSEPMTRGNAGVYHRIYRRVDGDQYEYLGGLFFHPLAFRVLEPTDEYPIRVMTYHRSSGSEGTVATFGYRDSAFVVLATEVIHPGDGGTDEGRARYAELFGD